MKVEILEADHLLMTAIWGEDNSGLVYITNHLGTRYPWLSKIGKDAVEYTVPFKMFYDFLKSRCVPRTRDGIDQLLKKKYHLKEYSPLGICLQTHGINYSDLIWLRFNDEKLRYDDVRVR